MVRYGKLLFQLTVPGSISVVPSAATRVETYPVTFTCTTNGINYPNFLWYFSSGGIQQLLYNSDSNINIQKLNPLTSSLTVVSVSRSDAGQYICSVNSTQINTTAVGSLTIFCKPL